jgi:hypothetical protein
VMNLLEHKKGLIEEKRESSFNSLHRSRRLPEYSCCNVVATHFQLQFSATLAIIIIVRRKAFFLSLVLD